MGINAGGIQFIIKIDDGFLLRLRELVFHRSVSFALAAFTGVSVLEDKSESLPSTDSRLLISASSARSQKFIIVNPRHGAATEPIIRKNLVSGCIHADFRVVDLSTVNFRKVLMI